MEKMKFKTAAVRRVAVGFGLGLFMAAQSAAACTLQNWSTVSGAVDPGGPNPNTANGEVLSPRYAGVCAMAASGEGFVEDTSPGGIDRIRARFYVLADNTGDAIVYEGFNGTTSIFTVEVGSDGVITLAGDGISQPLTAAGSSGNWNSIELDWDAGGDQVSLWVNSDAASENADDTEGLTSGQVVTSVQFGNLSPAGGSLSFDAYESRRTTPVGRVCVGDADGNGSRGIGDLEVVFTEIQSAGSTPASGSPDADENGQIGIGDLEEIFSIIQSGNSGC